LLTEISGGGPDAEATRVSDGGHTSEHEEPHMTTNTTRASEEPDTGLDPSHIMQVGMGFWASKTLLSAVEMELFTMLGTGSMTGADIGSRIGLHPRGIADFLDALVALALLDRDGQGDDRRYRNTAATRAFLDKQSPTYLGGILEMANARLYGFWGDLSEALRTGRPQNEVKHNGAAMFEELYRDAGRLEQFMVAMQGISLGNFHALADRFDFKKYETLCDVGGATGQLSAIVAGRHPHLRCITYDLPAVAPIAARTIDRAGLSERVTVASGDFLHDPLPKADVITMSLILHDWNLEKKQQLIRSAYDALPEGGAFIVIDNLIDDDRRANAFGLLMSLNMLIEFGDAFDYTGADVTGWCCEAGFTTVDVLPLTGPASAAIAIK
jgi:predicted O-methyltransferase YrrM